MSAPVEVWLPMYDDGTPQDTIDLEDRGIGDEVRYLRADLTCGECHWRPSVCPHGEGTSYSVRKPMASTPACMKFAPKERKP